MIISLLQSNPLSLNRDRNLNDLDTLINSGNGADIYILPEMFNTGFCTDPKLAFETVEGKTVTWMRDRANRYNAAFAGSLAVKENGSYFNRFCFVFPDGKLESYDKRHLFSYSGEDKHYTKGEIRKVIEFRDMRILPQICYDLRFPVFSRNYDSYDLAIYVGSWPLSRREVWDILLRARAIENQCYIAAVNRVGKDLYGEYSGGSCLIDPYGNDLAHCRDNKVEMISASIDKEAIYSFRLKFPVLSDADQYTIKQDK
ncbi:MAG TPA: amidohydrolase [Bacteroidaceae bacterium]|nr:amidohydrolase [Bacteroidaceae bacterium]